MAVSSALLAKMKANKAKYSKAGAKPFKFPEGKTRIRVLPHPDYLKDDSLDWHHDVAVHWIKSEEDGKPIAVVGDVEHTFAAAKGDHPFPDNRVSEITPMISQAVAAAKAMGDEEGMKLYKSWYARKTVLFCAIIRDGADKSDEPRLVEVAPGLFSDILSAVELYLLDEDNPMNPLDLKEGIDFIVQRTGKGKNDTTYQVMQAPSSKPVPAGTMDKLPDMRAHILREHFREGEAAKAIAAIGKLAGVSAGAALVAPRGTAMLTSKAAELAAPEAEEVIDVEPTPAPRKAATPAAKKAATASAKAPEAPTAPVEPEAPFGAPIEGDDLNALLDDLDGLIA